MKRFMHQIALAEVGSLGHHKIAHAKVLIIGAGGLGTPVATYLSAMGVGKIGIMDGDVVQESNLHRQFLYTPSDIGCSKVEVLTLHLKKQMSLDSEIIPYPFYMDHEAAHIMDEYDVVCDCTDHAASRIMIDQLCFEAHKPLVYAAVTDWNGYLTILNHTTKTRLSDIFPESDMLAAANDTCATLGVMGSMCGVLGSLQATEVMKYILGLPISLDGKILYVNGLTNTFRTLKLQINH